MSVNVHRMKPTMLRLYAVRSSAAAEGRDSTKFGFAGGVSSRRRRTR
jgi:hypothetical protein